MKKMLAMALVLTAMTLGTENLMAGDCGCGKGGAKSECKCGKDCKCGCQEGKECTCGCGKKK